MGGLAGLATHVFLPIPILPILPSISWRARPNPASPSFTLLPTAHSDESLGFSCLIIKVSAIATMVRANINANARS